MVKEVVIINLEKESNSELISLAESGNEFAFREIIKRYKPKIERVVIGMLGQTQEAEDVGEEVFIRFFFSMNKFKGEAELGTYLTRIAINLSLNELKRRKRSNLRLSKYFENSLKKDVQNLIKNFENKEFVEHALNKLSSKLKTVIVLRFMNSMQVNEISETLNIPVGTVLSRLARGQEKLKSLLKAARD